MSSTIVPAVLAPEEPGAESDQQPRPGAAHQPEQPREERSDGQHHHQQYEDRNEQQPHMRQAPWPLAGSVSSDTSPLALAWASSADFARSTYTWARPISVDRMSIVLRMLSSAASLNVSIVSMVA